MNHFRTVAVAVAASAATLLAACSSSGSGGGVVAAAKHTTSAPGSAEAVAAGGGDGSFDSKTVDVCRLLSGSQATAAAGVHYVSTTASRNMCNYVGADQNNNFFIIVFTNASGNAQWTDELSTLKSDCGATPKPLSGAGERSAGCGTEIGTQAGSNIIDVHGADMSGSEPGFPRSLKLAKAVAAALK